MLYIFWLLHQTTTWRGNRPFEPRLYIFWLLHQTTTQCVATIHSALLYIFWLLHQTTTLQTPSELKECCISFDSYIKPQHNLEWNCEGSVVYLLTPTSNHNCQKYNNYKSLLYIFWLLHQTTTYRSCSNLEWCCISFDSYIKPQLIGMNRYYTKVVYLLTPTSNHNRVVIWVILRVLYIFWLLHQTTTVTLVLFIASLLYIFWLLHQTTTLFLRVHLAFCCISFDSYIKPQPPRTLRLDCSVVYLLTPTSNHNVLQPLLSVLMLYIFWLLHQTTTRNQTEPYHLKLYIFWLLHQTTTG